MKQDLFNSLEPWVRMYWQPLVLAVLGLLLFSQLIAWGISSVELAKVDHLIAETQDTSTPSPSENATPPQTEEQKKENIPVKNIFRKDETNFQLSAIYLDKAVINEQVVGVGEPIQKFKVKEIHNDSVLIVDERGNEQKVEMFKADGGGSSNPSPSNEKNQARTGIRPGERRPVGMAGNSGFPSGINIPPGFTFRGMNAEQLKNMSQEQRRTLFNSLSESERQQLRERFRAARQK